MEDLRSLAELEDRLAPLCERVARQLPLVILPCPIALPPLLYYQLWHPRSHQSSSARWLRGRTKDVAANLAGSHAPAPPHHP